jgi:hypothetical protein
LSLSFWRVFTLLAMHYLSWDTCPVRLAGLNGANRDTHPTETHP